MMENLPVEIIVNIIQYLRVEEICSLSRTCRQLNYACQDDQTWDFKACRDMILKERCLLFANIILRIGKKCGWKTCYRLLYMLHNKQPGFFWDDGEELSQAKCSPERMKTLSVLMKELVCKVLKLDKIESWSATSDLLEALTIVLSTKPRLPLISITKTLLHIGEGPYQTGLIHCMEISTSSCTRFANIKQESYHCKINTISRVSQHQLEENYEQLIDGLQKTKIQISYNQVFQTSKQSVQHVVLRIIATILKHCSIKDIENREIQFQLEKSFSRKTWHGPTKDLQRWITYLIRKPEVILDSHIMKIDYFNTSVKPDVVALQMTYKEQIKLTKKRVNDYINEIIFPSIQEEQPTYFDIYYDHEDHLKRKREHEYLASNMVNTFSTMAKEQHKEKVARVCRLIKIAECLAELHNYASFKDMLEAIRGVLTFRSKTGLSWNDVGYNSLKTFVSLEEIMTATDNHFAYRHSIRKLNRHSIPLLSTHVKEINKLRADYNETDRIPVKKLHKYLYFDANIHKKQAIEISKTYHYFTGC